MKPTVLFLTVLGCVTASPSGYYHQEYNYKTSSSSYKNNELQHKTDDQGYYKKDGDLEGRVRPRVDANSEHSEYVNPNLKTGDYNTGLIGGANGDMSSYGHLRADVGSYGTHDLSSEGLAHADHLVGRKGGYSSYGSDSYGSNSYGSSQSYSMSSNLNSITSRLQQELESDLQRAIQENRAYSQSGVSISDLERELRQNLTNRLSAELINRYGQQSVRGGLSYTISGGRLHSTANYDNQELQDLRRQLENSLLNKLRYQYSQYDTSHGSHSSYGYSSTARPVYYQTYRPVTTVRPSYPVNYPSDNYIRYTPVSNPQSITTIVSQVQNQLDARLNELLEETQRRYFSSSSSYSLTNADVVLENLRNELRNNITYLINENVKANYGNQIPRDGHMYTVGSNGQTSTQSNYAISDLENLRSQIERNLIEKLNRDFESSRSRWYQQSSQSQLSHSSSNVQYGGYSTPRYEVYSTPRYEVYNTPRYSTYSTPRYDSEVEHFSTRPSSSHIAPLITSGGGSSSSSSSNRQYELLAAQRHGGYEISGAGGSSGSISQLQRQLQQDLSRQLQAAISRGHYGSYSTSGSYSPQTYQISLQQLTDELNRNLTRQLQEYSAGGYYSAHGNFDQAQLASLRSQLQSDLMRQLQQGLQQSFHSSSSYSASSSSSSSGNANYRPARGFDNYQLGQYRSGGSIVNLDGADCVNDDPNAYNNHRMKRSYQPYRSQPLGIGYSSGNRGYTPNGAVGYSGYGNAGVYYNRPSYESNQQVREELGQQVDESDLTQQVDDSDLTQQVEDAGFGRLQQGSLTQQQSDLGQQVDDSELTQQVEDSGIRRLQLNPQSQQVSLSQQVDDSDLTQQVEDSHFGKLELGTQHQQIDQGQQVDDSDLTQQVEQSNIAKLQLGSQSQRGDQGQQVDDSDLTQQAENSHFGNLELGSQHQQIDQSQQVDDSDSTQQVEDTNFGKLQLGSQDQQINQGQQVDDSDLTQQVEDVNLGRLQFGSQGQQQVELGQQVEQSDLTQQVEDSGKLTLGHQRQQQTDTDQQVDSTQQVEDSGVGRLQLGSHGQQQIQLGQGGNSHLSQQVDDFGNLQPQTEQEINNNDLTQQVEDSGLGKLPLSSQNQQQPQYRTSQNYDFTQQQQNPFTDTTRPASSLNYQQGYNSGRFTSQGQQHNTINHHQTSENRPAYEHNYLGSNFDQNQKQLALQLENDLSKQLKEAIKSYSISYTGQSDQQSTYQDLLRELERNVTQQLQALGSVSGSSRYSYSSTFNRRQVNLLQEQLENDLKLQLQQEISGNGYSGQQSTDQSNLGLNLQTQNNNFDNQRTQNSNSDLVQQQIGIGNTDFGEQTQTRDDQLQDLTQQVDSNQETRALDQEQLSSVAQTEDNTNGRLQLGTQQIGQEPLNAQDDLTQQVETNSLGDLQLTGQQQTTDQSTNQLQQTEDLNSQLTQTQNGFQNPSQYNFNRPYSVNRQFGNRPINSRPRDSSDFLNTEISHQQSLYSNPSTINRENTPIYTPSNLPTLNQVIEQQQNIPDTVEANTDLSNNREPLAPENNINQQVEYTDDQQHPENIYLSPQSPVATTNNNFLGEPSSSSQISQGGTRQDQFITQTQILPEAERNSDLLIQALQKAQQNRDDQFTSGHRNNIASTYITAGSGSTGSDQQTSLFNQHQNFKVYLDDRQVQLADQLENNLLKHLQDAISQNNQLAYTSTGAINPNLSYQINHDQLLRELQRNITKQIEETFKGSGQTSYLGYSNYDSLTQDQRERLIRELQTYLSGKLEQELKISYGQQQSSGHNTFDSRGTYSLGGYGSSQREIPNPSGSNLNNYGTGYTSNQLHYGQQEVIPGTEAISEYQPVQPEQPTVVQNVEPQVSNNYNIGVKGSRRSRPRTYNSPAPVDTEVYQSPIVPEVQQSPVTPAQINPAPEAQEVPDLIDETPQNNANLPWWKRFGNKIKQGATNLKEKIVG